jgi:hypothetical protein
MERAKNANRIAKMSFICCCFLIDYNFTKLISFIVFKE